MLLVKPIEMRNGTAMAIEVKLPRTTLLAVAAENGYIMCGALDVGLLNAKLADRGIIAGRAVGVRTLDELLEAPLESVTTHAEALGILPGTIGREAIERMLEQQ